MKVITTTNSTNSTISFDTSNTEVMDLVNLLVSTVEVNTTNELILGTLNTQMSILNSKLGKTETSKVVTTEVNLVELITPKLPLIIKVIKFVTFYEATIKAAAKPFKVLWSSFVVTPSTGESIKSKRTLKEVNSELSECYDKLAKINVNMIMNKKDTVYYTNQLNIQSLRRDYLIAELNQVS
jgi:hypothetical protein